MASITREDIADLTGRLYEAAYDAEAWPAAIRTLQDAFHGAAACFCIEFAHHADVVSGNCDPGYANLYLNDMLNHNQIWRPLMGAVDGLVATDQSFMTKAEFRSSVFYNEWYAPQGYLGSMACKVPAPQLGGSGFFIVTRGRTQPDFDAEDMAAMRLMAPVMMKVARLRQQFGALRVAERAEAALLANAGVGFALADHEGRLLHTSPTATDLLARAGLLARGDRLGVARTANAGESVGRTLQRLLARACAPQPGVLDGGSGELMLRPDPTRPDQVYAVAISPVRDAEAYGLSARGVAAVFVRQVGFGLPEGFSRMTRTLFGFSAREAEIAACLAAGGALKDAAASCGITMATARTYMARIFEKTETSQQSQVVALLRGLIPAPG
ncbi:hypothetical protein GCM10007301_02440 [Azorhizobium oxalatiphilum]|uniref:HTH luxR-type domain-containing protein n=1 Tax=Azorhizobium oxalatiphilum TaxID=980631 RepID=A0A917BKF0_9HYPH|nr:LuxR C-terminal-related transcriptional regulator [Azorhizobium oxalatiphilum]GGF46444.1 hypothetical protein GCM10007301_02440 [Azorhizobium oxalatiphilum]